MESLHALKRACILVERAVIVKEIDKRRPVSLGAFVVFVAVCRCDLDCAYPEGHVDER